MGLAGDDDLNRQGEQPLEVGEDQTGTLVGGEAARESDRQPRRVEAGQGRQPLLEEQMCLPERVRVELLHGSPTAERRRRLWTHADRAEELVELACEPGTEV